MADPQYNDIRLPCKTCGRSFNPEVLEKHAKICKKAAASLSKRKVFDSSKQRVLDGELSLKQIKAAQKKVITPPKTHWREKHQDFINAVRSSKGIQQAIESGGPLPPPPPPSINPDYIQCPYCSRRFSPQAAERHINFCKEQQSRLPRGKPAGPGAAKQNARLNYQPPKPKVKTNPGAPAPAQPVGRTTQPAGRGGPGKFFHQEGLPQHHLEEQQGGELLGRGSNFSTGRPQYGNEIDDQLLYHPMPEMSRDYSSPAHSHHHHQQQLPHSHKHNRLDKGAFDTGYTDFQEGLPSHRLKTPEADFFDHPSDFFTPHTKTSHHQQNQGSYSARTGYPGNGAARNGMRKKTEVPPIRTKSKPSPVNTFEHSEYEDGSSQHATTTKSRFCHECGTGFPVPNAKFCCECGMKRLDVPNATRTISQREGY